jgi:hypothetical protein
MDDRPRETISAPPLASDRRPGHLLPRMGDGLSTAMATDLIEPTMFAIFGGAGDLTWCKLVPAVFDLSQDRRMPGDFSTDQKLRRRLHQGVNKFSRFGQSEGRRLG